MLVEKFLFGNQLIAELENLIKNSKSNLLLISPYIDLDERMKDVLNEKLNDTDFNLKVLFGKNSDDIFKSIKNDSLDFFKKFPNIEIRYNKRLHAKFYQNDHNCLITSLNLYNFSLANNIEVGVLFTHNRKGLLGKAYKNTDGALLKGIEKIGESFFGTQKEINPIHEFEKIFVSSEIKFKAKSNKIEIDNFSIQKSKSSTVSYSSISQLSKKLGISTSDLNNLMIDNGLINIENKITSLGNSKGLIFKYYLGKEYISYPDNLDILKDKIKCQ